MLIYFKLLVGFIFLLKGADLLITGAVALAEKLRVPHAVIGLAIVSLGTSLPELIVSLNAKGSASDALVLGNILGSNMANTCLVLGVCMLIGALNLSSQYTKRDLLINLGASLLLGFLVLSPDFIATQILGRLDSLEGTILLIGVGIYLLELFLRSRRSRNRGRKKDSKEVIAASNPVPRIKLLKMSLYLVLGSVGLSLGADWLVESAVSIAASFQVSEDIIGVSILAIGTSLPELMASAVATSKGNSAIAIGNVLGSNIYNILLVLGVTAINGTILFPRLFSLDLYYLVSLALFLLLCYILAKRFRNLRPFERASSRIIVSLMLFAGYSTYIFIIFTRIKA